MAYKAVGGGSSLESSQSVRCGRFGLVVTRWPRSTYSYPIRQTRLVPGWVTVCLAGKPSRYVTSHQGRLSLLYPPSNDKMSIRFRAEQ